MKNCRKAAEYLAYAFVECDKLKTAQGGTRANAVSALGYMEQAFIELGRQPFEGYLHDKTHLMLQVESERPNSAFISDYAGDLQRRIMTEGWLDIIDCQTGKTPPG